MEFSQFEAVEHIGEPQAEVGRGVGIVNGNGTVADLDGNAEDFVIGLGVVFGGLVKKRVAADGEHTEAVCGAVAGVAVGGENDADKAGVASPCDDAVCDKFLFLVFQRRHDVKERHGNVGCGGYDAARGQELPPYHGSGLQVGVAVAVEYREGLGAGSAVGATRGEAERGERLLPQRHFGFDD